MRNTRNLIYQILVFLFFLTLLSYTYFEIKRYFEGPEITIFKPLNHETLKNKLVNLEGSTKNVKDLKINDQNTSIDELGNFKEKILMQNGYNLIKIEGKDKFNKKKEVLIEINVENS
jgi:hypothetical protein